MTARIIDGAALSQRIREEVAQRVQALTAKGVRPGLAVVLVGDDPASQVYVRNKVAACEKAGLHSVKEQYPADLTEAQLLERIDALNRDPSIHGILVQLPLPAHIQVARVLEAISVHKDVDGFHLYNVGALVTGNSIFPPCTPYGVQLLLDTTGIFFLEGYGLSETMAQSHSNPHGRQKLQCLGIPLFNVDSRIIDIETGAELPPGQVGEIVINGPQVMREYWQRPRETEEAFTEIGGRRFFRTGDLGYMDEEGYFFFADRLKRMVNVSGLKVWPAEVENKLHGHPAIQEACVISVPDERSGERARALIVLRPGMEATPQDIETWARTQMANYKVPRDYQFVDSLPRSPTGKVAWRQLQEQARAEMAAGQS